MKKIIIILLVVFAACKKETVEPELSSYPLDVFFVAECQDSIYCKLSLIYPRGLDTLWTDTSTLLTKSLHVASIKEGKTIGFTYSSFLPGGAVTSQGEYYIRIVYNGKEIVNDTLPEYTAYYTLPAPRTQVRIRH